METKRFQLLKSEFDEVMEQLQRAEDTNTRLALLWQLQEIIGKTNEMIRESQREIKAIREKLRSR